MKKTKRYKFLKEGLKSENGDTSWKLNEWQKYEGELDMCHAGFHCSKGKYQAFSYVQGEILAQVEVKGKSIKEKDKEVWSEMRVVKLWKWQKKDSVALAIYSAELVIDNFEKVYPDDKRPREAIEAAKRYLKDPSEKNRSAAESAESAAWSAASAAWSAASAASAAASAAESAAWGVASAAASAASAAIAASAARSVASAAWSAARSVASAAESAAWSVASAAESAARSALIKKISQWFDKRKLEKYD